MRVRVIAISLLLAACRQPSSGPKMSAVPAASDDAAWRSSIDKWKRDRVESIAGPDGWITLVARDWLSPGANVFGSDPSCALPLPTDRAPKKAGTIHLENGALRLEVEPGVTISVDGKPVQSMTLTDDHDQKPTKLTLGSLTMFVIKRGDRYALRVKDHEHPARKSFAGLHYYPLDPSVRVTAHLEPAPKGKTLPIVNVLGQVEAMECPGTLRFKLGDVDYTLDAVREAGENELFILFRDETAGHGTYPSGRFLYAPLPAADGTVPLDFNKAYNPPCAFTDFATCPIPPKQNHLARKIEAGERYEGAH